jgi:thiamine kinase-like enzyme
MATIVSLLDKKWVDDFLQSRLQKFFPGTEKLTRFEIKPLKIFLDYQRISARYNLLLSSDNRTLRKSVVVKAEKESDSSGKTSGTEIDYLANSALKNQGLGCLTTRALEYYKPLRAFFYEPIEGVCLKQLSIEHEAEQFLKFIPEVASSLKKIHLIDKPRKIDSRSQAWEEKQYKNYLGLMKKYYSPGFKPLKGLVEYCRAVKEKGGDNFSSQKYCLTHGDLHNGNIFVSDRRIKFLDFSEAGVYDPLSDLGCFFMHTELMFEYDFHPDYQEMMKRLKKSFYQSYLGRLPNKPEEDRILYHSIITLCKIISYVALNENSEGKPIESNKLLDKLIGIGQKKINI